MHFANRCIRCSKLLLQFVLLVLPSNIALILLPHTTGERTAATVVKIPAAPASGGHAGMLARTLADRASASAHLSRLVSTCVPAHDLPTYLAEDSHTVHAKTRSTVREFGAAE